MKLSLKDFKNSSFYKWLYKTANSNAVAKMLILILIWAVVSVPVDLYLLARWFFNPVGFWQDLVLVIAFMGIGWLQIILLFFGIGISIAVLIDEL